MPLPSNILKNIKKEAKQYQHIQIKGMVDFSDLSADNIRYAYEDGATAYAEQAQKFAKALKLIEQMSDPGSYERAIYDMKSIASDTLAEWEKGGGV